MLLGIASFSNYLAIYMIYCCGVVFCLYSKMALYNTRNQMEPSLPGSSTVNCMLRSCELMWCSYLLCSVLWMTRMSSTNLSQRLGVGGSAKGFDFKLLHEKVGNEGADGGTHGCTMNLFIVLTLEEEVGVFSNLKQSSTTIFGVLDNSAIV